MQIASSFQWRKKKGSNTHLLFLQQKVNKQYTAEPQEANQVEESEKDYKRLSQEKKSKKKKYSLLKIN